MKTHIVLGIDVGSVRVGLAMGRSDTGIAFPLQTLARGATTIEYISQIAKEQHVTAFVVGLPRNLQGDDTEQTKHARAFAKELEQTVELPVILQDEALTSVKAEERLGQNGKQYKKEDVDAMAACIIAEDYLQQRHNQ